MPRLLRVALVTLGLALVVGSTVWIVLRAEAHFDAVEHLGARVTPADLRSPSVWLPIGVEVTGIVLIFAGSWRRRAPEARA